MRIVGLPEIANSVRRASATVQTVGTTPASPKVAAETREAQTPIAASRVSVGTQPAVDHERVAEIRKALVEGNYPLVDAQIADAIIAAGLYGSVRS